MSEGGGGGAVGILGALRIVVDADTSKAQHALKSFGGRAQLMGAAVGAAVGGAAIAALKMGDKYKEAADLISVGTGATGKVLDGLLGTFNTVAGQVPDDIDVVANAVTDLYQKTGDTGDVLQTVAKSLVDLDRVTHSNGAAIEGVTKLYANWNVAADQQVETNNMLLAASQASGVGVAALADSVAGAGAVLRTLGLSLTDSTSLLAGLAKAGVDATTVLGPLRKSISAAVKAGEDPHQALQGFLDAIKNAPDDVTAAGLAIKTFGARGAAMADLIRSGKLDVKALYDTISSGGDTVQQAADDTHTLGQGFKELLNQVETTVGPLTQDFAGIADSLGNAIFLLPALGGLLGKSIAKAATSAPVKGAINMAGSIISKGIGLAMTTTEGIASALSNSGMWQSVGGIAGGKFGKAFGIATALALVTLPVLILQQLGGLDIAQSIHDKLFPPEKVAEWAKQGGMLGGTIFDSIGDGLNEAWRQTGGRFFGGSSNPAAPPDSPADAAALSSDWQKYAQEAVGKGLAGADVVAYADKMVANASAALKPLGPGLAKPITSAFKVATHAVAQGFGNVRDALNKPIKFHSIADRIRSKEKLLPRVMAQLKAAVLAGDPMAVNYWEAARAKVQGSLDRLHGTTKTSLKDIRKAYKDAGVSVKGTWADIKRTTDTKGGKVADVATKSAEDAKAGIESVDLTASGRKLMDGFAFGIWSGVPGIAAAANAAAAAAAAPLEAHSPPKTGPLHHIDKWGDKLVVTWVKPIKDAIPHVRRVADSLADAAFPRRLQWGQHEWVKHLREMQMHGHDLSRKQARWVREFERERERYARGHPGAFHDRGGSGGSGGYSGGGSGRGGAGSSSHVDTLRAHVLRVDRMTGGDTYNLHVGTLIANDHGLDELQRRLEKRSRMKNRGHRLNVVP